MTEYRFARPEDEEKVLDFIDFVFSQAHRPHDFARLLPKVYAHPGFSALHAVAVREDGSVRGTVAMLPLTVRMGEADELKVGYIGSVSAHPRDRGAGHMKALMAMQLEEARRRGYDLLALGGQRQRYGYWGFERGGAQLSFSLNEANVRHALKREKDPNASDDDMFFLKIEGADEPALEKIAKLHAAQPIFCPRGRDRLYDILCSFGGAPYAIGGAEGEIIGYFVEQGDRISELVLQDEKDLYTFLRCWMAGREDGTVTAYPWQRERVLALQKVAESCRVEDAKMFKILHWPRVLEAALRFRQSVQPLPSGRRVIGIEGAGTLALSVEGAKVSAAWTEETPLRVLGERDAVALFFSPQAQIMEIDPLLKAWLPLPLSIPRPDNF